jgi:leucyl/phenylalanyl-tRNA---protein transferase
MSSADNIHPTLDSDFLVIAYSNGYFPMASSDVGRIEWYSPDPRAIIPLHRFKVSRSLRQTLRKKKFQITMDTEFENVMRCCASRVETWISDEIIRAYVELFRRGYGHSIEVWYERRLVGGLYGVAINGAFFGESMFSRMTDASKVALVHLVDHLNLRGFSLLDTQFITDHLRQFGTVEIPRSDYLNLLSIALTQPTSF